MKSNKLLNLREKLDAIDAKLINLLSKRFAITRQIGEYKAKNNLPEQDINREQEKIEQMQALAKKLEINKSFIAKLYRLIFDQVVSEHKSLKITSLKVK
ncbi:MAG: hypothetical protein KatS3mg091_110 [Patescibacteria group bacterium]|nr:MAG: hypothetical protein KatS3mg091_110 [Patescibacteria group bacterium]